MLRKSFFYLIGILVLSTIIAPISTSFAAINIVENDSAYIEGNSLNEIIKTVTSPKDTGKDWTFMVYLDGDNNLEEAAIDDLDEMEKGGGTNGDINVITLIDRHSGYDSSNDNWETGRYYRVTSDVSQDIDSTMLQDLGEVDMSDPTTLDNFIRYCFANYPADKYCLIMWNHGSGVFGACFDDTTGASEGLTINEIQSGINSACSAYGESIEIIAFDCCLMGMIEVAYELRNYCDYFIGSEENIPFDGFDYEPIISSLHSDPTMNAYTLSTVIVDEYATMYSSETGTCLSAIDTSYMSAFPAVINKLVSNLTSTIEEYNSEYLTLYARRQSRGYSDSAFTDLKDLALQLNDYFEIEGLDAATDDVIALCDNAIAYNWQHSSMGGTSYGLSIFYPLVAYGISETSLYNYANRTSYFTNLDWTASTEWGEFIRLHCDTYHLLPQQEPTMINHDTPTPFSLIDYEHEIYSLRVTTSDIYEIRLDITSGDADVRLGIKSSSTIEFIGYSKLMNPSDANNETLRLYLEAGTYILIFNSKNTASTGTISIQQYIPISIDTNIAYEGSVGTPVGDGTGHLIQYSCYYYTMDLLASDYQFCLNNSISTDYQLNIYDLAFNLIASSSAVLVGEDVIVLLNSSLEQSIIIEIYATEGASSFTFEVKGESATKRFGISTIIVIPIFIISLLSIITLYRKRKVN